MDICKCFAHLTVILLASTLGYSDRPPPFFLSEPNSAAVTEGQNVTLTCEAGPSGAVDVEWTYNDTEINPRSWKGIILKGSTLHIPSFVSALESSEASSSHVGIYRCIARNKVGAIISRPARLSSTQMESCHQNLANESVSVTAGNTVVLPCRGVQKHVSSLKVEFELNNAVLKLSSGRKILPSHSLQLENVTSSDSGMYRCICPSSFPPHRIIASVIHLKVEAASKDVPSEFIWTSPRHVQVTEGQTLTLECAAAGYPVPLITWLRYGGILPANRHSQHLGILRVKEVHKVDEGTYICRAESTAGPPQIHVVFVDVLQPPKILLAPIDLATTEGARVTLSCKSEGSPKPSVTWYHNALPVVNSSAASKTNADGALVLMDVQENQSGMYQCIVSNLVDSTSASARVIVRPASATSLSHRRHNPADKEGDRALVLPPRRTTSVMPTPPLDFPYGEMGTYSQEPNTKSVGESPDSRETKSQLMQSDGERRRPGHKKPKGPRTYQKQRPKKTLAKNAGVSLIPPSKPTVTLISDSSAQLQWSIGPSEGLNVTLFKVQFKEIKNRKLRKSAGWQTIDEDIGSDVSEFTVSNLKPGSTYQFRLVAIYSNNDNKHGPNSDRLLMSVTGQRTKVPLTPPIIVAVHPLSISEISISWQFMPAKREVVNGFMIHYKPYETDQGYRQYVVHGSDERQVILSGLLQDTTYSLRMQSFNADGFSEYSNTAVKKTMGPSDNITDNYPPENYTPLFPPPTDDRLPPSDEDGSAVGFPRDLATTLRSRIESQVPLSRPSYSQQNTDLLFVVLGGVLGAVFIVVVFIIVFCFWRQRQQQLLIAALQSRAKTNNSHPPHLLANGLLAAPDYELETVSSAEQGARQKRAQKTRDHIPRCVGGCSKGTVEGCSKGAAGDCQPKGECCQRYQPTLDEWNSQFPPAVQRREKRPLVVGEETACTNSSHGRSRSDVDASDGDSVTSSLPVRWTSEADCSAEMFDAELSPQPLPHHPQPPHPAVTSFRPMHHRPLPSKSCHPMTMNSCDCDRCSCQPPSSTTELFEPPSDSLRKLSSRLNEGNNSQSGQSDSLPRSCTSDCSSSSSSSTSSSTCNHWCHVRQQSNRETNDSGVYDEPSDCRHHSTTSCGTGDQRQVVNN